MQGAATPGASTPAELGSEGSGPRAQIATCLDLPRRRGKSAATVALEAAIVRIVDERQPITVRGVCYGLFAEGLLSDMSVRNTQRISRVMTSMREAGALDWRLIVDGSRSVDRASVWRDPDQIIDIAVRTYRRDNWRDQPVRVEVWSEKSTVQGVLAPVLDDLGIVFRVMKGFGSYTAVRQAAEDDPDVVLYVGDWDPSGLFMSEVDLPQRLQAYGGRCDFKRIALQRHDLDALPHFDTGTKSGDARLHWYVRRTTADPQKCWELDAMDPNDLRERVHSSITGFMDMDAWNHSLQIEAAERESMQAFRAQWATRLNGDVQ